MKKLTNATLLFLVSFSLFGQTSNSTPNGFANYTEFKNNIPTMTFDFQLKKRSDGDVFMSGGISNFRVKKIKPASDVDKVETVIWGILVNDTAYINSYPYSALKGYNLIIEKGYYTYFIGEPARTVEEQRALGIIKPTENPIGVCCKVGYVILPDGTVKLLRPELLLELCQENEGIAKEIKAANLKLEDVNKMFDFLKKYNAMKK